MPHRIFFVEELVILITRELVERPRFRRDVVSLALTCRALESPALGVLWARQTMLSTLIQVLPPNWNGITIGPEHVHEDIVESTGC